MHGRVATTEQLTPGMVRVTLEGGDLEHLAMPDATDAYVNAAFRARRARRTTRCSTRRTSATRTRRSSSPRAAATRCAPGTPRPTCSPSTSSCTATRGSPGRGRPAPGPGDVLVFTGPSGGYRPDPAADWHLLVGDESALPAIAASLEALPPERDGGRPARLRRPRARDRAAEPGRRRRRVAAPQPRPGGRRRCWSTRSATSRSRTGRPFGFVHGEADEIRAVRHHLLHDRGLTRQDLSCSPYWRRTMTDEAWRQIKRDYVAAMEAEEG